MMTLKKQNALTFLEVILSLSIFVLLVLFTAPPLVNSLLNHQSKLADEELVHTLRHAHERATTQIYDSAWGVYLDDSNESYTLFAGSSYATRDVSHDRVVLLPDSVEFGTISLTGGGSEVIFTQITGSTTQNGTIELVSEFSTRTITVYALGHVQSN